MAQWQLRLRFYEESETPPTALLAPNRKRPSRLKVMFAVVGWRNTWPISKSRKMSVTTGRRN
jgi:hypothetical protein